MVVMPCIAAESRIVGHVGKPAKTDKRQLSY